MEDSDEFKKENFTEEQMHRYIKLLMSSIGYAILIGMALAMIVGGLLILFEKALTV